MTKKQKNGLKILFSIVLLGVLFWQLDTDELVKEIKAADPLYFILSIVLSFVLVATSCWKWWTILRYQNCPIPFLTLYRWYFIGYFYSNFLPSNVGGDLARSYLAGRRLQSQGSSLMSVFAERISGVTVLLLLVLIMPFTVDGLVDNPIIRTTMLLALVLLFILVATTFTTNMRWVNNWIDVFCHLIRADRPGKLANFRTKIANKFGSFAERRADLVRIFKEKPEALITILSLTFLFYALAVVNILLAYRTFGSWPAASDIAAVMPAALLIAMIPLTAGNLGIAESSYVFFFGLVGMGNELTLAMGLFLRLKVVILGILGAGLQMREPVHIPKNEIEETD